jgi:hypothetical protein
MFNLTKADKTVIAAFLDQRPASSKKLITDGQRLDGLWMGGMGIAEWRGRRILFTDLGSKAAQIVQHAIEKKAPRNWLGGFGQARGPELDPEQEQMLHEIVLMARNDGRYYPNQPAISVEQAIKEYIKIKTGGLREDAQIIRRAAVREVQHVWRQR